MDKQDLKIQALIEEVAAKAMQIADLRAELTIALNKVNELEATNDSQENAG